ncbi:MAG: helix-turn-helix transcriptional regulator [Candidatus Eisenbacteria bacterium]
MRLSERDLDALQHATLALHVERELEALRAVLPDILLPLLPCDWYGWFESGFDGDDLRAPLHSPVLWEHPELARPAIVRAATSQLPEHPFTQHSIKTGNWGPHLLTDFWSAREIAASDFYRRLLAPIGMHRVMSMGAFRGNRFGALNLARKRGARAFDERERALMRWFMPHFVQAVGAAERITSLRSERATVLSTQGLTPREADVALWLARGRTNPEIAVILAMKPRTVEKHVENILHKLGVENRTAAAMLVSGATAFAPREVPTPRRRSRRKA